MGSPVGSGRDGEESGDDAGAVGRDARPGWDAGLNHGGWQGHGDAREGGEGVDLEAQAVEATAWLAACRRARAQDAPDNAVDAAPIADPELAGVAEVLGAAVDALAVVDLAGRDGKDLLELTVGVNRAMDRLAAIRAHGAAAFDKSMEWTLKNSTAGRRLSHRLRVPDGNSQVTLGHNLATMPLTDEAFTAGLIAQRHINKLAPLAACDRTAKAFADYEETLVGFAKDLAWRDFCHELATWQLRMDPDGAEDNASADEANRRVHLSGGIDGTGILDGILTPYGHATVKAALDLIYNQLLEEDKAEARDRLGREPSFLELARTPPQRRHDALVRMAELSQQADPNGRRPAPLVSIVLGRETFSDVVARIENTDTIVPPGVVARIFDDHHGDVLIERIVFDGDNRVVDISDRRFFTGKLRRAIEIRDHTCTWPGCDTPAVNCQIDHIIEHTNGGETSQTNGQTLCRPHNLIKERTRKLTARQHRQRAP